MPNKKKIDGKALMGYLMSCGVALLLAAVLGRGAIGVLDAPEVHVSHASGKCVRVRDSEAEAEGRKSEWSCSRLPPHYDRVWVP